MAYAIVGTTNGFTQAAVGAALSPAWGTGQDAAAGELLIFPVAGTGTATFPTTPSGWSVAIQIAGTSCSATVFYKIAVGSDTAPSIALLASTGWGGLLWSFSGNATTTPVDKTATATGTTTSPTVVTASTADIAIGQLVICTAAEFRSSATADSAFLQTGNNGIGFSANQQGNDASAVANHSNLAWGTTTSIAVGNSSSVAHATTAVTGVALALASFKLAPVSSGVNPNFMGRHGIGGAPRTSVSTGGTF